MSATQVTWIDANQLHLAAAFRRLRDLLLDRPSASGLDLALETEIGATAQPPAISTIEAAFGLSPFERDLLLLCAAMELDAETRAAIAHRSDSASHCFPTFGMALDCLPDAHWSALAPEAPLRRWRFVETTAGTLLTDSPLRASERIVHFLAGVRCVDTELAHVVSILHPVMTVAPSQQLVAETTVRGLSHRDGNGRCPVVQLLGHDPASARTVAGMAAQMLGLRLAVMRSEDVPVDPSARAHMARLWEREALCSSLLLFIECVDTDETRRAPQHVARFLDEAASPMLLGSRQSISPLVREDIHLAVGAPTYAERLDHWRSAVGETVPFEKIERIAGQFGMSQHEIQATAHELELHASADRESAGALLWNLCRERVRPRLDHLSDRIIPAASWDCLILPPPQKNLLRDIATHMRWRNRVYGSWGFGGPGVRGLGITALFAGPSGTGKTMAAEVLARELELDMYRIDLSRVVSKYIGETEKSLARIFDEAETAGSVILLFDEADALFGKRTEVRDSHDRYANLEVSYLLQRMESYDGLAILTTNMKGALDPAFLRRIRFIVPFPFPDSAARLELWRGAFPEATPIAGLQFERLAKLNVAGGNIRNIALNAAFAAAEHNGPVEMQHILTAARSEFAKLERPLADSETRGWVGHG